MKSLIINCLFPTLTYPLKMKKSVFHTTIEDFVLEFDCWFFFNKASSMVENNDVEENNNIYYLGKVIKTIVIILIFFKKIKVYQW